MQFLLVLLLVVLATCAEGTPIRKTKRSSSPGGIHQVYQHGYNYGPDDHHYHLDLPGSYTAVNNGFTRGNGHPIYYGQDYGHLDTYRGSIAREVLGTKVHTHTHTQNTITKEIGVPVAKPYPVPVEKRVPVPVPQPYPVHIPKPVPVRVEVKVPVPVPKPYPVHVTQRIPVRVPVYVPVPEPVRVEVPVPRPYPVQVEKHVPVPVRVPVYVRVPVPIEAPQRPHIDHIDIHHTGGHSNRLVVTESSGNSGYESEFGLGTGGKIGTITGRDLESLDVKGGISGFSTHGHSQDDHHDAHIDLNGY